MFRGLIPALADRYHVIAPDYLGFGLSDAPPVTDFDYTFERLTDLTEGLLDQLSDHVRQHRRHRKESFVCRSNVTEAEIVEQDLLHNERRHRLRHL